ncbi:MAG: hypothetical protein IPI33_07800 [Dehalococcoidia bacterium]|jgi:hypothetical protein|uniref:hypothetical protein n=1 Tax=Candidatus Amarobacter glycogenicus TaxID=3140699 RepID=UPI001D1E6AA0|nr:hypothetical protein [Dehalococcoidia bacterium]MBK6561067.1 hypothetical protein [Dehalococcoidia bacterium]MBK7125360.1 hypothetical protein [Dehalococcoidia bacterium]MBK7328873.1 hypothetical protein [Dehalococcoidia bacterium]MBK7725133.1 hypothetical protein [Dehalococcoidia bacterium]
MYRRILVGVVAQGQTRDFLSAMREANTFQTERGIRARTAVWGAMTGQNNSVVIAADFNTLEDLEKWTDLATEDSRFAIVRREVRSAMIYEDSEVSILRLAYHSEGLMTSEDATAPRKYMRVLHGDVKPGSHREFVLSVSVALDYQKQRGIDAHTSVWSKMTGHTSGVSIVAEFDSLGELEKFDEMAVTDAEFGRLRAATRASMVFLTSETQLMRNLM